MKHKTTVAIHTLGCKLNQAESELLARQFTQAGYYIDHNNRADIHIVNTCTVTHIADRKSRQLLRRLRHQSPMAMIIATGCYAERAPQELAQIGGIDLVVGNKQKTQILELVDKEHVSAFSQVKPFETITSRVRTMLKIQDGCNDFCSYCIVPEVRGQGLSLPLEEIINEVRARVASGYKEVVLTGTKIGSYSYNGATLELLIKRLLAETNIKRLRLSSLQPQEMSAEFLSLWNDTRLCRHFHLALQSGSDNILERMKRRYSSTEYKKAVTLIHDLVPDAAITTDIIIGFPQESEHDFEASYHLCQDLSLAKIHVFPYSPRSGTLAATMPQVKEGVKREREQKMLLLAQRKAARFREQFWGRTMTVLWEKETFPNSGVYSGLTDNYIRVFTHNDEPLTNRLLPVKLLRNYGQGLWGEIP